MNVHCPECPTGSLLFHTRDGILTESCDRCAFTRRVTPVARVQAPADLVVAVCQKVGCGAEFSFERTRWTKRSRLPRLCPPCRKAAYNPSPARRNPFWSKRKNYRASRMDERGAA